MFAEHRIKKALEEESEETEERKPGSKDGEQEKKEDPIGDFFKGVKKALGERLEDSEKGKLTGDLFEELKKASGKGNEGYR